MENLDKQLCEKERLSDEQLAEAAGGGVLDREVLICEQKCVKKFGNEKEECMDKCKKNL